MATTPAPVIFDNVDGRYTVKLNPRSDVHPLMVIKSVRRIPEVLSAFKSIDFIDKVYFRNYPPSEVCDAENDWLKDYFKNYTHVIISSDDIAPTMLHIKRLLEDVKHFDFPAIAGYCNMCYYTRIDDEGGRLCEYCVTNAPHNHINVTLDAVQHECLGPNSYNFLTRGWAENRHEIRRAWYQGMACGVVSRGVWEAVPFRSWNKGVGGLMEDLAFAKDCADKAIPQFVDFRVGIRHYGTHHGKILVGKEERRIDFEPHVRQMW